MAGTPLANFTDFMKVTGPSYLTSAEDVLNEAAQNTYVLDQFIGGRDKSEMIQGGSKIKDVIMTDEASTYDHYEPNATFTWQNPQTAVEIEAPWRFSIDHMSWTDQEIELNVPDGLTKEAQKVVYKRLKKLKEQRMWTSMINGIENDLWADAANLQGRMESSPATGGVGLPYSIPAFINEKTYGIPTGWTTVMTVNPTTESRWRPQLSQYDYADPNDNDGGNNGIINGFEDMAGKLLWVAPKIKQAANANFEKTADPCRRFIACSRQGSDAYRRALRANNDSTPSKQDAAYLSPMFGGIPLMQISKLETATIYDGASSTRVSELSASTPGWRYYFLDGKYLKPVIHSRRFFYKKPPASHPNQPYTTVQPTDCWWNLWCHSRQRLGLVAPGG